MIDPQLVIVGLCVAAAATWLVARVVGSVRGKTTSDCGAGCSDCSRRVGNPADDFVPLDQLFERKS